MTISFLGPILPILDEIGKKRKIKLRLVGVKKIPMNFANLEVECIPWSIETESELVSEMDLGLFCLPNDASAEYRGGGKLFVYMASGVPFIATNKGVSAQIMRESNVGFPVNEIADWAKVLVEAIDAVDKRNIYAKHGRAYAIKFLSKEYYTESISTVIEKIA
jgi:glycosyltransferase involved in cell wall biosynthesis